MNTIACATEKAAAPCKPSRVFLLISAATAIFFSGAACSSSVNIATRASAAEGSFASRSIAEFDGPWAIAFLPDGRLLVTEEAGRMYLVNSSGTKIQVRNLPDVDTSRGDGLLDVTAAPDFRKAVESLA
jgi:aldose sugar dehydrogenase